MSYVTYENELSQNDEVDLREVLVGRRIISAEKGDFETPENDERWWTPRAEGLLTLDDGTKLYVAGNDGGCSCGAGDYELTRIAAFDNVITNVRIEANPDTEDYFDGDQGIGFYKIFVITDNEEISVAEFEGSDGNGYYGTGFWIRVIRPTGS